MTDENTPIDPDAFTRDFVEKNRAFSALSLSTHDANKKALFDVLERVGITKVLVEFDGAGDSGQMENVTVTAGDKPADLPADTITLLSASWGESETTSFECSTSQAVETLAMDLLGETHCGWENNEGAYGEFTFDVAARSIVLDFNERIETSEYTQHVF